MARIAFETLECLRKKGSENKMAPGISEPKKCLRKTWFENKMAR